MKYMMLAGNCFENYAQDERGILSFVDWATLEEAQQLVEERGYTWAQLIEFRFSRPFLAWEYDYSAQWGAKLWMESGRYVK